MIYLELLLNIILYNAWAALVARINSRNITLSFFSPLKWEFPLKKYYSWIFFCHSTDHLNSDLGKHFKPFLADNSSPSSNTNE